MTDSTQRRLAYRLLQGLEAGGVPVSELQTIARDLDPVLVHVAVRFVRDNYPASNPAASAVLERLMALTRSYPGFVARAKQGEQDPVSVWFAADHSFREFRGRGREMINAVADKLES